MKTWESVPVIKNERKAIESAVSALKAQFPVEKVILFGSKVRGTYDKYSDIDLLVITSRVLNWKEEKAVSGMLFDIGLKYDVIFSPLFVFVGEWEGDLFTSFPIYQEIIKDGAVVA